MLFSSYAEPFSSSSCCVWFLPLSACKLYAHALSPLSLQWIRLGANILELISRKMGGGGIILVCVDMAWTEVLNDIIRGSSTD